MPLLLGHRGARRAAPENTLAAFDLALQHGCQGFEFDVRRTKDGRAIICHDPQLLGLTLEQSSYSSLVEKLRAAHPRPNRSRKADPEFVPCLEDVVNRYSPSVFLDIEMKVSGMEEFVLQILRRPSFIGRVRDSFVVSSFLPQVLRRLHELNPEIPLGWICDDRELLPQWHGLPCQVLVAHFSLTGKELIEAAHSAGKKLFVWTLNREEEMRRFAGWGADAIISDDTELLGRVLRPQR